MKIWITNQCNNYESIRWWLFELEWRKDEEKLFEKKKKVRSINNQNLIGDKKSKNSQSSTIARNRWCDRFDDHHYNPNGFLLFLSFSTLRKKNSVENPQNSLLIHSEKIFFKKERRKKNRTKKNISLRCWCWWSLTFFNTALKDGERTKEENGISLSLSLRPLTVGFISLFMIRFEDDS